MPQKVMRTTSQKLFKTPSRASLPYEDEKFSYLILRKTTAGAAGASPRTSQMKLGTKGASETERELEEDDSSSISSNGRIILRPMLRKRLVLLDICETQGDVSRVIVSKRGKYAAYYRNARKAQWGDLWPPSSDMLPRKNTKAQSFAAEEHDDDL